MTWRVWLKMLRRARTKSFACGYLANKGAREQLRRSHKQLSKSRVRRVTYYLRRQLRGGIDRQARYLAL